MEEAFRNIPGLAWLFSFLVSMPGFVDRWVKLIRPPQPQKTSSPIRIGLLGASKIAPVAVVNPALSHPEVVVTAVAARDRTRAETYANRWSIPIVHDSYEALIEDPDVDAVYVPLPNGLHFEWALKTLKAGKHVLLEKPSVSNGEEARILFNSPLATAPGAPVLLEAFHYRFHPAFTLLKSLIGDVDQIQHVTAAQWAPAGAIALDDIRFKYNLAGGTLMDFGAYTVHWLRHIFEKEPEECVECTTEPLPPPHAASEPHIDKSIAATWNFPGGRTGDLDVSLHSHGKGWSSLIPAAIATRLPSVILPRTVIELREQTVADDESVTLNKGEEHRVRRTVTMWNPIAPFLWHRVDIDDLHTIRNLESSASRPRKTWHVRAAHKAYTWRDVGEKYTELPGEPWWSTYRHQLEQFVNRVKEREGSGVWIDHEDSIKQMDMIDSAYRKRGWPVRPTSEYRS